MFLPINYPQSVHRSYLPFHVLQFFETVFGTVVSVLCNQALLTSVGVSAEGSVFGAVAVQWIIKDGAGEVAKLFFIRKFAPYFDSHPKTFTLFGECIVAAGSGLQIATLLVNPSPGNFLLCAAGGNVFKLIGYAIWFTTHIKFMRYFAQYGNTGDVAAKDESQASIAQLTGYAAGIGLLTVSHSAPYLYSLFFLVVPAHIVMTTCMMRVATFELLTLPRLAILTNQFTRDEKPMDLLSLNQIEEMRGTGLFGEFYKTKEQKYLFLAPRVADVIKDEADGARWVVCTDVFMDEKYLLYPSPAPRTGSICVFYHPDATSDDMMRSVLHAARLRRTLLSDDSSASRTPAPDSCLDALHVALSDSAAWTRRNFGSFKQTLEAKGWRTDEMGFADHGHRVLWGPETERGVGDDP
ncbi:DUF647-domain-containing protein [Sparassis crispa]|uniref:DUF647-domain-containing protein n=1 Tax=Sparassis crispa TaxID=139825 RepID=A0A401H0E0_9APHY|nr:DUF647-domain-containing protein [Sparassis crispa]GBE87872.1 DUF647-domain-containing protein [Sparassis crispa]